MPFQIRRSMIDGNKGHKQIRTLVKSLDEVRRWRKGDSRLGWGCHTLKPPHFTPACCPKYLTQHFLPEVHRRGDAELHLGAHKEYQLQVSRPAGQAGRGRGPQSLSPAGAPFPPPEPQSLSPAAPPSLTHVPILPNPTGAFSSQDCSLLTLWVLSPQGSLAGPS